MELGDVGVDELSVAGEVAEELLVFDERFVDGGGNGRPVVRGVKDVATGRVGVGGALDVSGSVVEVAVVEVVGFGVLAGTGRQRVELLNLFAVLHGIILPV